MATNIYENGHLKADSSLLGKHNYSLEKGMCCPLCNWDNSDSWLMLESQDFVGTCTPPWPALGGNIVLAGVFRCPKCFEIYWFHLPWDEKKFKETCDDIKE